MLTSWPGTWHVSNVTGTRHVTFIRFWYDSSIHNYETVEMDLQQSVNITIAVMLHATHKYPASSYKRNEEWSKYWGFSMTGRRTDVLETSDRRSGSLEHLQFTWISWHQGSRRLCRQPCWIIRHWAPTLPGRIFYSRPLLWGHSGTLPWQCQVKLIQPPLQSTSLHWFKLKWAR